MGNSCCADRRLAKNNQVKLSDPPKVAVKEPRDLKKRAINVKKIEDQYLKPAVSSELDVNESLIEELEYDLEEIDNFTDDEKNSIVTVLDLYNNDIPSDEQEFIEGYILVKVKVSENYADDKVLLISNYAIYILKPSDLTFVFRRVHIENIQVVLLDDSIRSLIFHMNSSDVAGDLWVLSKNTQDIHNCVQTMFRYLTQRYIPVYSVPDTQLQSKFNSLKVIFVKTLMEEDYLKANNVVIQEGSTGETIILIKKTKSLVKSEMTDCIALLTTKALYCLNERFSFISRLDLKKVKSITITESSEDTLIETTNNEAFFWVLGFKFLKEIEKSIALIKNMKVPINKEKLIDVDSLLKVNLKKLKRT